MNPPTLPAGDFSDVCAVIIGIDHYKEMDMRIAGPCYNAVAIATWLLQNGTPAGQIHLFLSKDTDKTRDIDKTLDDLRRAGVDLFGTAKHDDIQSFLKNKLPEQQNSRLFMFWSGHGAVTPAGHRIFAFENFTQNDHSATFDATNFCAELRTLEIYARFRQQIILADVCGKYQTRILGNPNSPLNMPFECQQLQFFASCPGGYAYVPDGRGQFTMALMEALTSTTGWPGDAGEGFFVVLKAAFAKYDGEPHFCIFDTRGIRYATFIFGKSAYADSCLRMLENQHVSVDTYYPHFRQTLIRLGVGNDRLESRRLPLMLDVLCDLRSEECVVPYGLIEFLVRLQRLPELVAPIQAWLAEHAAPGDIATAQENIEWENKQRHVIVWLESNAAGQLTGFRTVLRFADNTPAVNGGAETTLVSNIGGLKDGLSRQLYQWLDEGDLSPGARLHIVAHPPLFHLDLQDLPVLPDGSTLSETFVVTLHNRGRVTKDGSGLENLREWDRRLRKRFETAKDWIDVAPTLPISEEPGLRVTNFTLVDDSVGRVVLRRLLLLGAPYLCLPHRLDAASLTNASGQAFPPSPLSNHLRDITAVTVDLIPHAFYTARLRGKPKLASHASLLWDDPYNIPFTPEVRQ